MLHNNHFSLHRLGRSVGRTPGWLSLVFVVVGLVMMSIVAAPAVNAQDAPNVVFYIARPASPLLTAEGVLLEFDVTLVSDLGLPLTLTLQGSVPSGLTFTTKPDAQGLKGKVSWTPGESHGGGEYTLTFKGTGDMIPPFADLVDTEVIVIKVAEMNTSPKWDMVGNKSVNEHNAAAIDQTVSFKVQATDDDFPAQTLTYTAANLPNGATFNAGTREFNWSPSESQGGTSSNVTFTVTDGKDSVSQKVTITVKDINDEPYIAAIEPLTVYEANYVSGHNPKTVSFKVIATDDDIPAQTLTYSAIHLPLGATFDPATQMFSWSPSEQQGSVDPYFIGFVVVENSSDELSFEQTVSITVKDVNESPLWLSLYHFPITINENNAANDKETISFTVNALDFDHPKQTLSYGVYNLPDGATFNTATKTFSWAPSEAQGNKTYDIQVWVSDDGSPMRIITQDIEIIVREINDPPKWVAVPAKTVNEDNDADDNETVSFTVSATDSDIPAQTLTYSASNLPFRATLNPTTGEFSWSPNEAQGGDVYTITFTVTDNASPQLSRSFQASITVNEYNNAPFFFSMHDETRYETQLLEFMVEAVDNDYPKQNLSYTAENLPPGAEFDADSHHFTWQTTEADGGSQYDVTFIVADDSVPQKLNQLTINILVAEANVAPVLAHIEDVVGQPGDVITFTLSATDSDLPADTLTYSMGGALDGMTLDPNTGKFSWTVTGAETYVPYGVGFTVTDSGDPQQSASQIVSFSIQEENLLKNPGFQVAGETAKQAKGWKGVGLLPSDKRVCKPSSETISETPEEICEFQFSATPAKAVNRKLRQQLDVAAFTSSDTVQFSGIYEPKALTNGARVQLVAKLADGTTKRATVKLATEVENGPEMATFNSFEQTLVLTAAPVSVWLEISTGKSSGKLFLDNLQVVVLPPSPEIEMADAPAPTTPNLIPVPAAPDLRGGAAIGMGQ